MQRRLLLPWSSKYGGRLDLQHDGVVLMVESLCGRASPTCSRERERLEGSSWPAARVGVEGGCAPAPPYIGGRPVALTPPPSPRAAAQEGRVGGKFPPSFWKVPLGFPLRAGWLGLRGLVRLAQSGQDSSP
jgi:hypothetical protein